MASAIIAAGRISEAATMNERIPEGVAIDQSGAITTDPKEAVTVLPLGGPKGSGRCLNASPAFWRARQF
jgi:LDH2 family malate/lactate/ureidoglycolate dehydrogenase